MSNLTSEGPYAASTRSHLGAALEAAVPLWIAQLQQFPWAEIAARREDLATLIASKGDVILYKSKKIGETAAAFNGLAEGLAMLAFSPGGVTFLDRHWEAVHPG